MEAKTYRHYFEKLPAEIQAIALKYCKADILDMPYAVPVISEIHRPSMLLSSMFIWEETEEGHNWWKNKSNELYKKEE